MKVLLVGGGGREHALAWKISQSPRCEALFIAPGNAGTAQVGTNVDISPTDFAAMEHLIAQENIDMVVVGPEQPLVVGIADYFEAQGIQVIGPNKAAAQLEGSKAFSKYFMEKYHIPTAKYKTFEDHQIDEAFNYLRNHSLPVVVKASGLAAGKGVLICETQDEAVKAVKDMLSGEAFGNSGKTVIIEEFLQGVEASIFILTDGKDYLLLPTAKDYKRVGEGDTGLNTGGMGAVSPAPFIDLEMTALIEKTIVQPTLEGLQNERLRYRGFIFIGLKIEDKVPYVLEYNARMGDPETQVIIPRLNNDLLDLLEATTNGTLKAQQLDIDPQICATVVLVSGGYPGPYEKGMEITGLKKVENSWAFHAGTIAEGEQVLTNGGRVVSISSLGANIEQAVHQSLTNAVNIYFEGQYYRTDIGKDLLDY